MTYLEEYCNDEMKKLKQICYPILIQIGGISEKDYDDFYSIALDALADSALRYDETKKCLDLLRKKEKYDYIFIDENMDKINAIRFLNKCKEIPNFNGKVYIILNKSNVYYEKKLIEEGFSGFIVSSVKTKEFTNFINSKL